MATFDTVRSVFLLVFAKCPDKQPKDKAIFDVWLKMWSGIYREIEDEILMNAAARWVATTTKVFPGDCPFSRIREMAGEGAKTTQGDMIELANESVSRFGMYREDQAIAWLEEKSPLAAAAMRRFGFREYCTSDKPDVARGQLRAIFQAEAERADTIGYVQGTAQSLEGGKPSKSIGNSPERRFLGLVPEGRRVA